LGNSCKHENMAWATENNRKAGVYQAIVVIVVQKKLIRNRDCYARR